MKATMVGHIFLAKEKKVCLQVEAVVSDKSVQPWEK